MIKTTRFLNCVNHNSFGKMSLGILSLTEQKSEAFFLCVFTVSNSKEVLMSLCCLASNLGNTLRLHRKDSLVLVAQQSVLKGALLQVSGR